MSDDGLDNGFVQASFGKLINFHEKSNINLPKSILKNILKSSDKSILFIYTPDTKILRILPAKSHLVIKISAIFSAFEPELLKKMGDTIKRLGIKSLYSSGLCFTPEKDICIWEAYFDSTEFELINKERFIEEIQKFPHLFSLKTTNIEPEEIR